MEAMLPIQPSIDFHVFVFPRNPEVKASETSNGTSASGKSQLKLEKN